MTIERLEPVGAPPVFSHYSTVTRADGRLYVSGLVALNPDGSPAAVGDAGEQARQICLSLRAICEEFGAGLDRVLFTRLYITDRADYAAVNAAYAEAFGDIRPSRATLITGLVHPDFLVELTAEVLL
jgi:aminoacrylate peracid reductase